MRVLVVGAMILSALGVASVEAAPTTYNAVVDFSKSVNTPTSQWSYRYNDTGARNNASYLLLPNYAPNTSSVVFMDSAGAVTTGFWSRATTVAGQGTLEVPHIGANQTGNTLTVGTLPNQLYWPKDYFYIHPAPGPGFAVLSFLVPKGGQADVAFTFENLNYGCSDGIRWYVDLYENSSNSDTPQYNGSLNSTQASPPFTSTSQSVTIKVKKDDRLNFLVDSGPTGDYCADWTGAKVEIKI